MKILVINGINLCMTGTREPGKYGTKSLDEINTALKTWAKTKDNLELEFFSTNFEGSFVERLYAAKGMYDGIVMNAGAWSHYSIGIRDAIAGCGTPIVEVHMTNIYAREDFRHNQLLAPFCVGLITGFGDDSYRLGIEAMVHHLKTKK